MHAIARPTAQSAASDFATTTSGAGVVQTRQIELSVDEQRWLIEHPETTPTGYPTWFPFEVLTQSGNYVGIVAETATLIEAKTGVKFKFLSSSSWSDALRTAANGEADVISGDLADEIIKRTRRFTVSYLEQTLAVVTHRAHKALFNDLRQIRVSAYRGYPGRRLHLGS